MVRWVDSAFAHGWMPRRAIKEYRAATCISIGLLVNETKDHITIVQSASMDEDQYGDGITIPKRCIEQMWRLKVK